MLLYPKAKACVFWTEIFISFSSINSNTWLVCWQNSIQFSRYNIRSIVCPSIKMGSLNKSHHESTGGVVIFNGELILLYCDAVHCEVEGKGSVSIDIWVIQWLIILIVRLLAGFIWPHIESCLRRHRSSKILDWCLSQHHFLPCST